MPGYIIHKRPIVKINRHASFRKHSHFDIEILCLLDGSYRVTDDHGVYDMTAGDIFVSFPFENHTYEATEDLKPLGIVIIISPDMLGTFKQLFTDFRAVSPYIPHAKQNPGFADALRRVAELAMASDTIWINGGGNDDTVRDTRYSDVFVSYEVLLGQLVALICELVGMLELVPYKSGSSVSICRILSYISAHFGDSNLSMKALSKATGLSQSQITRLLADKMDTNFSNLIHKMRITEARNQLSYTDKTVTEVAYECGFSSLRTFNRVFLSEVGMTPSDFRREIFDHNRPNDRDPGWR